MEAIGVWLSTEGVGFLVMTVSLEGLIESQNSSYCSTEFGLDLSTSSSYLLIAQVSVRQEPGEFPGGLVLDIPVLQKNWEKHGLERPVVIKK